MQSTINIGLNEHDRRKITEGLSHFLADSYTLYLMTHNFHWNVKGAMFQTLHTMFETQYTELALAVDAIAERIRALGFPVPATFHEFVKLTTIKEPTGVPVARDMIYELIQGHEGVIRTARTLFPIAEGAGDDVTAGILINRMEIHEKTAWMLRSLLDD